MGAAGRGRSDLGRPQFAVEAFAQQLDTVAMLPRSEEKCLATCETRWPYRANLGTSCRPAG